MKDYYSLNGRTYGKYNEYILLEDLNSMTNQGSSNVKSNSPEEIYIIDAKYLNGNVNVFSVTEAIGFSPNYNEGSYILQLDNKRINIPNPAVKFEDGSDENGQLGGSAEIVDSTDFTVIVSKQDVGNIQYGKFLDNTGKEIGVIKFSSSFLSYPLSKQIVNVQI